MSGRVEVTAAIPITFPPNVIHAHRHRVVRVDADTTLRMGISAVARPSATLPPKKLATNLKTKIWRGEKLFEIQYLVTDLCSLMLWTIQIFLNL